MPFFPCLLPILSQTLLQVDKYILAYIYTKYMLQKRNKQQQKTFAFFFFFAALCSLQDLSSPTSDGTCATEVTAVSLNHRTPREFPQSLRLYGLPWCLRQ